MKASPFGYKSAWLAFRDQPAERVVAVLQLRDCNSADWQSGLKAAYDRPDGQLGHRVFVTPSLNGWTLVVGTTEVQYFATHRVVEAHIWARAVDGHLVRAFSYVGESGETRRDDGKRDPTEEAFGFFVSGRAPTGDVEDEAGDWQVASPREEHVMAIARAWSLDPSSLDGLALDVPDGIVGAIREPRAPRVAAAATPESTRPWWRFW
jgi:hypothetical protein